MHLQYNIIYNMCTTMYNVFHRFGQAQFGYGGLVLSSS